MTSSQMFKFKQEMTKYIKIKEYIETLLDTFHVTAFIVNCSVQARLKKYSPIYWFPEKKEFALKAATRVWF